MKTKRWIKNTSYGEDTRIDCPECGDEMNFEDLLTDGFGGGEHVCESCDEVLEINVDYSVELSAWSFEKQ